MMKIAFILRISDFYHFGPHLIISSYCNITIHWNFFGLNDECCCSL